MPVKIKIPYARYFYSLFLAQQTTLWCNWLRHCATSRKVAGFMPEGVNGIPH
jgi:hypothetical protein